MSSARISELETKIQGIALKGLALVEDDARPWAEKAGEHAKIDTDMKALQSELSDVRQSTAAAKAFQAVTEAGEPADTTALPVVPNGAPVAKSIGHQFVEANGFKAFDISHRGAVHAIDTKATLTVASGAAGGIAPEYHMQVVPILLRRMTVTQLIPGGTITGGSLIYPKESSITNAAASVAEGGAKPGSDLNITQVTETLHKIATSLKVSDETLQDFAAAQSYIDGRLALFVQLAEEDQLLNGSGSGSNMTGLLNRSGLAAAQAVGADTVIDAIFKEITKIRTVSFVEPDGIVINPSDWQSIRLSKDANDQYYGGGPFTGAYGNGSAPTADMLWGMPVVVTPLIAQGTALVGAFGMCSQVFRKGGLRVEATNSNEDDFLKNLVAIRAELRELLAVYRPSGFGKVTGLT